MLVFAGATGLLAVALLEAMAHLSVDPGPNLQADFGAIIGSGAALLARAGLALSTYLVVKS
jgi:hypothetical protein